MGRPSPPPSGSSRAVATSLLLRAVPLVAAGAAGVALRLGGAPAWLAALGVAAAWLLALEAASAARRPRPPAGATPLAEAAQPDLLSLVREVAARLGAAPPRRVHLSPGVETAAAEAGGLGGGRGPRSITLGVGLLAVADAAELRASVARALARAAGPGAVLERRRAAARRYLRRRGRALAAAPVRWLASGFLGATDGAAAAEAARADGLAAAVVGPDALARARERERVATARFAELLRDEVDPLLEHGYRPTNVYDGFRAFEEERAGAEDGDGRDPRPGRPAPPPLAGAAAPLDRRPARSLLANAERLEREMSERLVAARAPGRAFAPVGWTQVAARVYGPRLADDAARCAARIAAAWGGAATPAAALRTLAPALARRQDEAAALVLDPALADAPGAERAALVEDVLVRTLGALLGAALVERGGAWRSEVGRPLEVVLGQEVLAPHELASRALDDRRSLEETVNRAAADLA